MPKMTKTQVKRSLKSIKSKARTLFVVHVTGSDKVILSSADIVAIDKIVDRGLKRLG